MATIDQNRIYKNTDVDVKINIGKRRDKSNSWNMSDITSTSNSDLVISLIQGNITCRYSYRDGNILLANNSITLRINDTDINEIGEYKVSARLYIENDELYGLRPDPEILISEE